MLKRTPILGVSLVLAAAVPLQADEPETYQEIFVCSWKVAKADAWRR